LATALSRDVDADGDGLGMGAEFGGEGLLRIGGLGVG